jgi:hypothetical protein
MDTALDAALAYASRGWYVFPVHPAPAKHPLCETGFKAATIDQPTIVSWWTRWPNAQVGVACGTSAILSVDLDEKPKEWISGMASLTALGGDVDMCNLLMGTPRNNGRQMLYWSEGLPTRRQLGVLPGVDLLGDGGYTIMPSPASPGREWLVGDPLDHSDLEPMPDWLMGLAGAAHLRATGEMDGPTETKIVPLDEDQVADIRAALACIPNDERGLWIRIGMALKSTGAGDQAYHLWRDWSRATPTGEVHPKFHPGHQLNQWQRLKVLRMDGSEVSLATLFFLAQEHGYQGYQGYQEEVADIQLGPVEETKGAKGHDPLPPSDAPLIERQQVELSDWTDVARLPAIEWQIEGLIPRASLTVLAGDTESGKSFCWIDIAMRLVHNLPFAGMPVEAGSVIYLAGEGQAGMAARFRAWQKHHQHLGLDAEDRYCVVSSEIPVLSKRTMGVLHDLVKRVVDWKGHAPSMIIIDTLSQGLDDGDENEAKVVSPVIRGLMALRTRWRASIGIAHHLVKLLAKGHRRGDRVPQATRDSVRGSSALTRNIDTVLGLLSDEDEGPRRLCVWKQKDGSKVEPIDLWLLPVETGWQRAGGEDEWSCILIPDACKRIVDGGKVKKIEVEDPTAPNPQAIAAHKAAIEKVVATLRSMAAIEGESGKGAMSGNEICQATGTKRGVTLAAIKGAARAGLIVNKGTDRAARWVVPE